MRTLLFVPVLVLLGADAFAQPIPPAPFTCTQAVDQSNLLAYNGRAKNTADYWCPMYDKDREYFWKRMLGWQAGGEDVALSGAYAMPPSAWFAGNVVLPQPTPPPVPVVTCPATDLAPLEAEIGALRKGLEIQMETLSKHADSTEQFQGAVKSEWSWIKPFFKAVAKYGPLVAGGLLAGARLGQ